MSTSFSSPSNEWDSDVDESNSSEEFMFVKGPSLPATTVADDLRNAVYMPDQLPGISEDSATADIDSVWNTHHDKVPVSSSSANGKDMRAEWLQRKISVFPLRRRRRRREQ